MSRSAEIRKINKRKRTKIIFLSFEGGKKTNKTEKLYFHEFFITQKEYKIVFAARDDTDIDNMVESLKETMKSTGFRHRSGDRAFVIIDIDNDKDKAKKVIELSKNKENKKIEFIVSNPCFEIWFLLHYKYTTRQFNCNNKKELENHLIKEHVADYSKSEYIKGINDKVSFALANSYKLKKHYEGHSFDFSKEIPNPYTNVNKIIELLVST